MDRAHRLARKQEQVTATKHGGRGTPASGSGELVKNDVRNAEWSFEVKSTTRASYSLSLSVLDTAERNALTDGRRAALVLSFDRGIGKTPRRFVLVNEDDFLEMVDNGSTTQG
jgi:hypothetical protein